MSYFFSGGAGMRGTNSTHPTKHTVKKFTSFSGLDALTGQNWFFYLLTHTKISVKKQKKTQYNKDSK